jgi:hypothetical protein
MKRKRTPFAAAAAALILAGVALQAWLASRGGIGGDQYVLFDLGLDYLEEGRLSAFGKGMSGGGFIPGSLLQLLIGVPFSLWHDYRSPVVLIGVFHLLAALVSLSVVRQAAGSRTALFFLAVWWLSPWRLYHSGILWEPAYVVLPSALHLLACWKLRARPGAAWSALLAATLVLTFQLHGSFLFLVILTAAVLIRKLIRLHWAGVIAGAAAGGLTLMPTVSAFMSGTLPSPAPTKSFVGYGLVSVVPVLKGFVYWFRLGSLDIGRRLKGVVFLDEGWAGAGWGSVAVKAAVTGLVYLSAASVLVALAASWWYFLSSRRSEGRGAGWLWLRSYALAALVSLVAASALSPVTIQSWHVVIVLPAACLPVALWLDEQWPPGKRWLRLTLILFLVLRVPQVIAVGAGHEAYRLDPAIETKLQERQKTLLPEEFLQSGTSADDPLPAD